MLKRTAETGPSTEAALPAIEPSPLTLAIGIAQRRWRSLVVFLVPALALGLLYLIVTPSTYMAKAYLLLDTRKLQINLYQNGSALGDSQIDYGAVDSQLELLRSDAIARSVVEDLDLAKDPEATGAGGRSFLRSLAGAARRALDPDAGEQDAAARLASEEALKNAAVGFVRGGVQVQRVRQTYIVEISFRALDPARAARIANGIAEAYILDQTQSKQTMTKRAVEWLQQRAGELREQAIAADRALQDYKTKNNIIQTGRGTLDEQQVGELTSQMTAARAKTLDIKTKLDQLRTVTAAGRPDAILSDIVSNEIIAKLRQQYVDASRRLADYTARLGREHEAVLTARKDMQRIQAAAIDELKRAAEGLQSDLEIAQARERAVEARLRASTEQEAESRQGFGTLQALDGAAKSYRQLYESFLQRYVESTQQQSLATTEARVLTPAQGGGKVWPLTSSVMLASAVGGLLLGAAFAYAQEQLDASFRSPKQVERALGLRCLGVLPAVAQKEGAAKPADPKLTAQRLIGEDLGVARQVMLTPFSRFTETIRSIKVAADVSAGSELRVIGVVSALPGEGKSTLSANLAQLIAHGGSHTLLIDADFRNPSLTRTLAPEAAGGLAQVIDGSLAPEDAVWSDPVTGLYFLPNAGGDVSRSAEILASRKTADFMAELRAHFDYIIVDLPPLAPVVDARAASQLIDGFVMVIEWGQTSPEAVTEALESAEVLRSKLIGAVLNRANVAALKRIEAYKGGRYHNYYTRYTD